MQIRCLIVDELHESITGLLEKHGIRQDYFPEITRREIKARIKDYDGLIIRSKTRVDADLIGDNKLSFVARAGAGIDNLDVEFLNARGIEVLNAPEGNRDAVGEHTIGLILNLLHNISVSNDQVINYQWKREANRGWELSELTVGIFGYGNSGSALAEKLSGFGCKIVAFDKFPERIIDTKHLVDLEQFFTETDILSLHIPLTTETDALFSNSYFNEFKKQIIFINTARGEIAPLGDIKHAMEDGKIVKAGLDVLECEKFTAMTPSQSEDFEWLKNSGRVLFTPHIAGWTHDSYYRINVILAEKIVAFLEQRYK